MMKKFDCKTFCDRAISLFGDMGQIELSEEIGISQGVISAIKNKKSKAPGADTIFKIARYFNVSIDWLIGYEKDSAAEIEEREMDTKDTFATRITELRKKRNISQQQLADAVGVTRQSLSHYEQCRRTIDSDLLAKLAGYFNVTSDYLLGLSDAPCTDTSGCEQYITYEENKLSKQREEIADALEKLASSIRE